VEHERWIASCRLGTIFNNYIKQTPSSDIINTQQARDYDSKSRRKQNAKDTIRFTRIESSVLQSGLLPQPITYHEQQAFPPTQKPKPTAHRTFLPIPTVRLGKRV